MKEHSIKIEKTAHYYSIGELNKQTNELWIVCHGYGQLASFFIDKFKELKFHISTKTYNDKFVIGSVEYINSLFSLLKKKGVKHFSSSLYEGNPKGVLEAMSQGCIVFVSKNENTSEIINNGEDGFLYNLEKGELKNYFASDFLNHVDLEIISTNAKNKVSIQNSLEKLVELEISDFNQLIQKQ